MQINKKTQIAIFALRIGLGLLFLWAGLDKLLNNFSAVNYLIGATTGPFKSLFASMSSYPNLINFLVISGELGVGVALVTGTFVRFAAVSGSLMMILFYLSTLPQKTGPISQHIIYILVFALLFTTDAGKFWGLDTRASRAISTVRQRVLSSKPKTN